MNAVRIIAALVALTATAQAEWVGQSTSKTVGNSNVEAKFYVKAGLTHCTEAELGDAREAFEAAEAAVDPTNPETIFERIIAGTNPCLQDAEEQFTEVEAYGEGAIELFGRSEYVYAKVGGRDVDGIKATYIKIRAFGNTLYDREDRAIIIARGAEFKKEAKFGVGGLNVTVKGSVGAVIGVQLNGDINAERVLVVASPFIGAGASASASIGVFCANASIEGDIDALDLGIPVALDVGFQGGITYDIDVDLDYALLDGKLKVKLSYCLGDASKTLAEFSGWDGHRDVFNGSGAL